MSSPCCWATGLGHRNVIIVIISVACHPLMSVAKTVEYAEPVRPALLWRGIDVIICCRPSVAVAYTAVADGNRRHRCTIV